MNFLFGEHEMMKISLFIIVLLLSGCGEKTVTDVRCTNEIFNTLKNISKEKNERLKVVRTESLDGNIEYIESGTKEQKLAFYVAKLNSAKAFILTEGLEEAMKNPKLFNDSDETGYHKAILHEYYFCKNMIAELNKTKH